MALDRNLVKITVSRSDFDKIKTKLEAGYEKSRKMVAIRIEIVAMEEKLEPINGTLLLRLEPEET